MPFFVPAFRVFMVWDVEHNDDPHNRWLRNFIIDTTQELQQGSLTPT
ncbi:hypothetical protein [Pseudomonas kielensis]|uniref:Uncharacterized protein n=1 Tax=Pseudomonas kielensis TaxID=2762577 RepID=A0A7X1GEP5_9PSED|nr:hypothetical protein [Pseudomonas kielensis]MBC2691096.1 hypothetical protein [Pseudomonas kielensis]